MKLFEANFDTILWRFYLLMTVVIGSFLVGVPLLALLALPIFLTAMLGISFDFKKKNRVLELNQQTTSNASIAA